MPPPEADGPGEREPAVIVTRDDGDVEGDPDPGIERDPAGGEVSAPGGWTSVAGAPIETRSDPQLLAACLALIPASIPV
jgi:hypothetical protein